MDAKRLDYIANHMNETLHLGGEDEAVVVDGRTLEVIHKIRGKQPVQAIKAQFELELGGEAELINRAITPDVTELTVERNPEPLRSPAATAASLRLLTMAVDAVLESLNQQEGTNIHLLHGATLRPARATTADVSTVAPPFEQAYYCYQTDLFGDQVAEAAGEHLNWSAPWLTEALTPEQRSDALVKITGKMRMFGAALSIALSGSSPLTHTRNGSQKEPVHATAISPWNSTRLGHIWPNRTAMDSSTILTNWDDYQRTMLDFAKAGLLKSGRDVWLPVRPQAGPVKPMGTTFEEVCLSLGIDTTTPEGFEQAREMLATSFRFGPQSSFNEKKGDRAWQTIEQWRQEMLENLIKTPRNRSELRTLETPPPFEDQTPYEFTKSIHAFFELLFTYLANDPEWVRGIPMTENNLVIARKNEGLANEPLGLDHPRFRWPNGGHITGRQLLRKFLEEIQPLAKAMGRVEDLQLIQEIAAGARLTPAARIRQEVAEFYEINIEGTRNFRALPNDEYAREMVRRPRLHMARELEQIRGDVSKMPSQDQPYIEGLIKLVDNLRNT